MGDNYDVSKELIIEYADKTIVLCASIFLNIIIKMYFYDQLENIDLQEQNSTWIEWNVKRINHNCTMHITL